MDNAILRVVESYAVAMSTDGFVWYGGRDEKAPVDMSYLTCSSCGGACAPHTIGADGLGVRFALACDEHGVQSVIDPFADSR